MARHGKAHHAGLGRRKGGAGRDDHVAFGLAVELVDRAAECGAAPVDQLGPERLAPRCDRAQGKTLRRLGRGLAHDLERGWRQERVADTKAAHEVKRLCRGEFGHPARDNRDPVMQRGHQHVEQPADPGPIGGCPDVVAGLGEEIVAHLDPRQMAEKNAMGVKRPFGVAGRAGGIDQDRGIIGSGVGSDEIRALARDGIIKALGAIRAIDAKHTLQRG